MVYRRLSPSAALLTPYISHDIDNDGLSRLLHHVRGGKIKSFVTNAGEVIGASQRQRKALIDAMGREKLQDEVWIDGSGCYDAKATIELGTYAMEHGADAIMVVHPGFWGCNAPDYNPYYQDILKAGLPTIIYRNPEGDNMQAECVARMAEHYDNLIGVKTGDPGFLLSLKKTTKGRLMLSCGNDALINWAAESKMDSTSGWSNVCPEAVWYMANRDSVKAGRLQTALNRLIGATIDSNRFPKKHPVAWLKAALRHLPDGAIDIGGPEYYAPITREADEALNKLIPEFVKEQKAIMDMY